MLKAIVFAILAILVPIHAQEVSFTKLYYNSGRAEMWGCSAGLDFLKFDYVPLNKTYFAQYYDSMCGYPPATGSVLLCAEEKMSQGGKVKDVLFKTFEISCKEYSSYTYDWEYYRDQYKNATKYLPLTEPVNTSLPVYFPTLMNMTAIDISYISYHELYFNEDSATWFCVGICGYFLLLIVISTLYNFARNVGISKSVNRSRLSKAIQKYIIFNGTKG